jgi:hypothetical protein
VKKLPTDVILVKGAWASSSDAVTALPEGGKVTGHSYTNPYFGLDFLLPADWTQQYDGPPPSDSGYYVLMQLAPTADFKGPIPGSVMVTAEDLFFTPTGARTAQELVSFARTHLQADYTVERAPTEVRFAGHSFLRFDYLSPVAGIHWRILATQIRCHTVKFVFTSRDPKLIDALVRNLNGMVLPDEAGLGAGTGGGDVPLCVPDFAREPNILQRVDPVFTERRFNPVPVRIIIDQEGKVKHIHLLSAFPDQSKSITDALQQWRFKPYLRDGQPVEVETGVLFGSAPRAPRPQAATAAAN